MQQIEDDAAFVELLDSNSIYLSMIKQGALLYTERDQEKRWAEYFQEILDRGPVVVEVVEDIYISIKPPTEDEFVTAIKDLYNGKARWDTKWLEQPVPKTKTLCLTVTTGEVSHC